MASKSNSRGFGGMIFNFFWLILIAAFVIAFLRINNITDVYSGYKYSWVKAQEISACVNKGVNQIQSNQKVECSLSLKVGDYESARNETWGQEMGLPNYTPSSNNSANSNSSNTDSTNSSNPQNNNTNDNSLNIFPNNNNNSSSSFTPKINITPTKESKESIQSQLDSLQVVDKYDSGIRYNRTEWKHWVTAPGSRCWNTREEVLYNQAVEGSVVFLDKNNEETTDKFNACAIKSGKWIDPYTNKEYTKPTDLDIDHTVALKAAAMAGGQNNLTSEQKSIFANDVDHLVVTSAKENRTKGAKTPSEWMPSEKSVHCEYAKIYIYTSGKYNLLITQKDKDVLQNALNTCKF